MGLMHNKALWLTLMSGASAAAIELSGALTLLGDDDGLALDFTDDSFFSDTGFYGSAAIVGGGTQDGYDTSPDATASSLLTYTSPSVKMTMGPDGLLRYAAHNLFLNSASPANQSVTVVSGATYSVILTGSVTTTLSGAATGTITAGTTNITAATTTLTFGSTSGSGTVQVTRTPADTTYLATAGAVRYSLPYEWSSAGVLQGLLVEESRTNACPSFADFSDTTNHNNSGLLGFGAGSTVNATASPTGVVDADLIVPSTANAAHWTSNVLASVTSGTTYTSSWYVKAAGYTFVQIVPSTGFTGASPYVNFNLSTGAVGNSNAATGVITALANGWYRVSVSFAATATSGGRFILAILNADTASVLPSFAGDGTSGIYVWGGQFETGAFITSPIETFASTVTRAADNISLATSAFPCPAMTSSAHALTLYVEYTQRVISSAAPYYAMLSNGTGNDSISSYSNTSGNPYVLMGTTNVGNEEVNLINDTGSYVNDTNMKVAFRATEDNYNISVNGDITTADTSADILGAALTTLQIGSYLGSSNFANTTIKKLMVPPVSKTNAALVTLTGGTPTVLQLENSDNLQLETGDEIAVDSDSSLPANDDLTGTEYVVIVQDGVTKKATIDLLKDALL